MALTNCKECGKEISSEAKSCPNCGFTQKKKTDYLAYVIFALLILLFFWMIDEVLMPSNRVDIATYDEYQKVNEGLSYREVVQIIGAEGEELSRNKIQEIPGVMESVETIMYQWVNKSGSSMNAIFQNDKLIQKTQFGLK
jgi:hypothetical protein